MTDAAGAAILACGTAVDTLAEQVHAGRAAELSDHQRDCPHCRAALAELSGVLAPLHALAREPVAVPRAAVDRIDRALALVRGGSPPPVVVDVGRGSTRVGEGVVVAYARRAAERVPGVRAALVHVAAVATVPGGSGTALEVVLAATYGADLRALGDRVRRVVAAEVAERTGVRPALVSALIDTVVE